MCRAKQQVGSTVFPNDGRRDQRSGERGKKESPEYKKPCPWGACVRCAVARDGTEPNGASSISRQRANEG